MGTVTWRVFGNGSYDSAFIDASGGVSPYVYTGCDSCGNIAPLYSWFPTGVGDQICTDGSVNLENCNVTIQETNLCVYYSDFNTNVCNLDGATSNNGSWAVQKGDSGGPVYIHNGGGLDAYGTISGESGTGQGSSTVFFTPYDLDLYNNFQLVCTGVCN